MSSIWNREPAPLPVITRPAGLGTCDRCVIPGVIRIMRAIDWTNGVPVPASGAPLLLVFCAYHAATFDVALHEAGWVVVEDLR